MPHRAAGLFLMCAAVLVSDPAAGQGAPDPPGPYVIDVHGVSIGLPEGAVFFPPVAAGVPAPSRGAGFDVGAHVYAGRLGSARLGFGANLVNVRGKAIPQRAAPTTTTSATPEGPPGAAVDLRTLASQVSFNFGTEDGWSYLGAGAGFTEVIARTLAPVEARRESGRLLTINAGGGARWFLTRHIAFGFDARLYRVAAADTMPASMLFAISAGVSLR